MTDNQHDIIQQLLSHDADCTLKAETERNILHLVAIHGDDLTMNNLKRARLMEVDPEARDSLGKTASEYFEQRYEKQSASDAIKDAFTTLIDTISARRELRDNDGAFPDVFYDAAEDI